MVMGRREANDGDDDYRNGNKKKTGQGKDHEERRKENDAFFGLSCPPLKPKMGIKKIVIIIIIITTLF